MTLHEQFNRDGYLVLEDFYTAEQCDALMKRGVALSENYDFKGHPSVFQTNEQTRTSDDYFLNSGDAICYFFEKDAFDEQGKLKNELFYSLNKIGHALHDLDPVFEKFSRSPQLKALAAELKLDNYPCYP